MADRPLHVDPVRREAGVELVGHRAVEITVVLARVGAELREIERRVAGLERIHRPRDDLDALIEAVIALRFLELARERRPAVLLAHGEHVRVVPEVVIADAEEAKDEAGRIPVALGIPERDEATVVHYGEEHVRRHRQVAAPGLLLQRNGRGARRDVVRDFNAERHRWRSIRRSSTIRAVAGNAEFLKRVSWFQDLDNKSLDAISNAAVEQNYQPGQLIMRQGDT